MDLKIDLIFNPPEGTGTTNDAIAAQLLRPDLTRLRMAVAFASAEGARLLLELIEARKSPLDVKLVIGLDGLVTEPKGIKILAERFPKRVRLFETSGKSMFHTKTLALDGRVRTSLFVFVTGSSNLTSAGFSKNREANVVIELKEETERDRISKQWHSWFQQIWDQSENATSARIREYEARHKAAPRMPAPDRIMGGKVEVSQIDISDARELWIDAGAITGGSSNQLEIPARAVSFFRINSTDYNKEIRIRLIRGSLAWNSSLMSYYRRNQMWRINLDTSIPEIKGKGIRKEVLHFLRTHRNNCYEFNILSVNQIQAIMAASRVSGNIGHTRTRSYGWM